MKKKLVIWQAIIESIEKDLPVMLLYVLESLGSSPGRQGFFMTVNSEGKMAGSIGGGIMEHKLVELAKEKLNSGAKGILKKQVHDKSSPINQSGMICSGEQTVFLYHLQERDKETVEAIIEHLEKDLPAVLEISPVGIKVSASDTTAAILYNYVSEKNWLYKERIGYTNQLYIIGGGHCALALSRIMFEMDFKIHIIETREGLNTLEQNTFVHKKKLINSYSELSRLIPSGNNIYITIMTFGYRTDDIALRALMDKEVAYVGVLGSKRKIEKMFDDYKKEGFNKDELQKIYAPIGIPIKSETPEEIAISIAAEIIKVKNSISPNETSP